MLIDAFTYFNEKELVELRLKYLSEIVDCFLIVEADFTHTGKEKKWNFPEILKVSNEKFSFDKFTISVTSILKIILKNIRLVDRVS